LAPRALSAMIFWVSMDMVFSLDARLAGTRDAHRLARRLRMAVLRAKERKGNARKKARELYLPEAFADKVSGGGHGGGRFRPARPAA
jgi:hypothetical protein